MAPREKHHDATTARFRWLVYTATAVLGLYAVYAVGVNGFLALNGLQLMFKSTNQVNATYRRAYSLWPGVVHVEHLRVTFQDQNVEFSLDIASAHVRVVLWELAKRRFHATNVAGAGAIFRMRHRIDPWSKGEPWVTALPPIPEFLTPAVFEATVPEPPIPDEKYDLWTVHLEHVNVQLQELWVQFVRLQGRGRVRGAFRLVPARKLWVGPAELAIEDGRLSFGKERIAAHLRGTLDCHVDPYDVRVPQGREVFRMISAGIVLDARDIRFDPFGQFFFPKGVGALSDPGTLTTNIHVRRGRILQGSQASYAAPAVHVTFGDQQATVTNVHIDPRMQPESHLRLPLTMGGAVLEVSPPIEVGPSTAAAEVRGDDTSGEFRLESRGIDVSAFTIADAHTIDLLVPNALPVTFAGGKIAGALRARDDAQALTAESSVTLSNAQPRASTFATILNGQLHASFAKARSDDATFSLTVDGEFKHSSLSIAGHDRSPVPSVVKSASVHAAVESSRDALDAKLDASIPWISVHARVNPSTFVTGHGLRVTGRAQGSPSHAKGSLSLGFDTLRVRSSKIDLAIEPMFRVQSPNFDVLRREGEVGITARFRGWNESYGDDGGQCSSLNILAASLTATSRVSRRGFAGKAQATIDHVAFAWGKDFKARANLRWSSTFRTPQPGLPALFDFSTQLVDAEAQSGNAETQGWQATAPEVRIEGQFTGNATLQGELAVTVPAAHGRIGHVALTSAAHAAVHVSNLDERSRQLEFAGKVDVEHLAMQAGSRSVQDWRASIDVGEARLQAQQNLDITARFSAGLSDASPALAILEAEGKVPGWLASAIPSRALQTEGTLERRCKLTRIQFSRALGGPIWARGTLLSTSDLVRGSFLVRLTTLDWISAGINFGPPDAGFTPLAGESWLMENSARLDYSAAQWLSRPCREEPQRCVGQGLGAP